MLTFPALEPKFKRGCNERDTEAMRRFIDMLEENPRFKFWVTVQKSGL